MCASPDYLQRKGTPATPEELVNHHCLTFVRLAEPMTTWHFQTTEGQQSITIQPARMTNDGALLRRWAVEGAGIVLKSIWEVTADIEAKRLVTVLDDYTKDFYRKGISSGSDIHVVYPNREFLPHRTRGFIDALADYFSQKI